MRWFRWRNVWTASYLPSRVQYRHQVCTARRTRRYNCIPVLGSSGTLVRLVSNFSQGRTKGYRTSFLSCLARRTDGAISQLVSVFVRSKGRWAGLVWDAPFVDPRWFAALVRDHRAHRRTAYSQLQRGAWLGRRAPRSCTPPPSTFSDLQCNAKCRESASNERTRDWKMTHIRAGR